MLKKPWNINDLAPCDKKRHIPLTIFVTMKMSNFNDLRQNYWLVNRFVVTKCVTHCSKSDVWPLTRISKPSLTNYFCGISMTYNLGTPLAYVPGVPWNRSRQPPREKISFSFLRIWHPAIDGISEAGEMAYRDSLIARIWNGPNGQALIAAISIVQRQRMERRTLVTDSS